MLKLDAELNPSPAVGVRAFPDDTRARTFYLVAAAPAIARDDDGRAELSLIIYGRRGAEGFRGEGGVLTLTTMLQVSRAQHDAARATIAQGLAREAGSQDLPPIEISPVDWLSGVVTVSLVEGVQFEGKPSLTGANTCAFNARLTEPAAAALAEAWSDGLRTAHIRYDMRIRSPGSASGLALVLDGGLGVSADELRTIAPTNLAS